MSFIIDAVKSLGLASWGQSPESFITPEPPPPPPPPPAGSGESVEQKGRYFFRLFAKGIIGQRFGVADDSLAQINEGGYVIRQQKTEPFPIGGGVEVGAKAGPVNLSLEGTYFYTPKIDLVEGSTENAWGLVEVAGLLSAEVYENEKEDLSVSLYGGPMGAISLGNVNKGGPADYGIYKGVGGKGGLEAKWKAFFARLGGFVVTDTGNTDENNVRQYGNHQGVDLTFGVHLSK